MNRAATMTVALLILVAGCASSSGDSTPSPTTDSVAETPTIAIQETPTVTQIDTETQTPTPTPTPEPVKNPWAEKPVIIAIDTSENPDRNYTSSVERAVEYWTTTGVEYPDWNPNFSLEPENPDPHLIVKFTSKIETCGIEHSNTTIGCAPLLEESDRVTTSETVSVQAGLTNESTYRVVRHELGHVLGLEHGEGPGEVMAPYDRVYSEIIRVHLDFETTAEHRQRDTQRHVQYALDYYSKGADGHVKENIAFAVIQDRSQSDIVIEFSRDGSESRVSVEGNRVVIEVNGIPIERRGWHVGYWLGFYFGAESVDDLPPPFDEPDTDTRVGWWHNYL